MNRCLNCNALLTKEEIVCWECGTPSEDTKRKDPQNMFFNIVRIMFVMTLLVLVFGLFSDKGPSTLMVFLVAAALSILMRSMKDDVQKAKKR